MWEIMPSQAAGWLAVLLDATVKGAAILVLAGGLALMLRKKSAAVQHMMWLMALTALLALPVLSTTLPAWRIPILPAWMTEVGETPAEPAVVAEEMAAEPPATAPNPIATSPSSIPPLALETEDSSVPVAGAVAGEAEPAAEKAPASPRWPLWVLVAWGAGFAAVVLRLLAGTVGVWRLAHGARRVRGGPWEELVREFSGQIGLRRRVILLVSDVAAMPATWGIVRPVALIPTEADDWSEERKRIVMLHELAHVKRWDTLTQMVAQIACAFYWFNPLAWLAARQVRIERERACDDLVLASGFRATDYGEHLLEIVRSLRSPLCTSLTSVSIARTSHFEGRLLAILDPKRNRRALTRLAVIVGLVVLSCVVIPMGAMRLAAQDGVADEPGGDAVDDHGFGPIIEREIADWDRDGTECVIDLDSGRLFSVPNQLRNTPTEGREKVVSEWYRKNGIDAGADGSGQQHGLVGVEVKAAQVANERWETITEDDISQVLTEAPLKEHEGRVLMLRTNREVRATFAFKTREGGMGILQITGFTENPKSVKIRYKMVQTAKTVRFGIYLVKEHAPALEGEKASLEELVLEDKAVLTEDDLGSYDWASHTLHIKAGVKSLLPVSPGPQAKGFVIVADGQRVYRGCFTTLASSVVPDVPTISLALWPGKGKGLPQEMRIGPSPMVDARANDPRGDERIRKVLAALGKLQQAETDARTVLEGFIKMVLDGKDEEAKQCVVPGSAVGGQLGDLRKMPDIGQMTVATVHADEGKALAISSAIKADHDQKGVLIFTLARQKDAWLIEDIDVRTEAEAKEVLKQFLKDHPEAKEVAGSEWGEAVEGVQVRLRADKPKWKVGETPSFKADFQNRGKRDLQLMLAQGWEIEVDGAWYHATVDRLGRVEVRTLPPGTVQKDIAFLPEEWSKWQSKEDRKPLEFVAGKHTVRVAFTAQPTEKDGGKPVRVVSNAAEIEIVAAE